MKVFWALLALVLLILAGSAPAVAADGAERETGPYPIWLSPWSVIKSLGDLDQIWTRSFIKRAADNSYIFEGHELYKGNGADRVTAVSDTCKTLVDLTEREYKTERDGVDLRFFLGTLHKCQYLNRLRHAKPARISYVRDLELSEKSLHILPAFLDPGISCATLCRHVEANRKRIPLSKVSKFDQVLSRGPNVLDLETDWKSVTVKLLAKADFNSDGVEDIFVSVSFRMTQGTMWGTRNFVVTRNESEGILRVIDPQSHLCHDINYECDSSYPGIDALVEESRRLRSDPNSQPLLPLCVFRSDSLPTSGL
jgi:hypothetical protein